ncbi:MAG: hypothetical protein RR555_10030 [Bacteroidales bacterium]
MIHFIRTDFADFCFGRLQSSETLAVENGPILFSEISQLSETFVQKLKQTLGQERDYPHKQVEMLSQAILELGHLQTMLSYSIAGKKVHFGDYWKLYSATSC